MKWSTLPPITAIRAFAAFVDKGDVQSAGAALNVSHAAISQQLRQLETHLGVSLLDRSGRALTLTAEGQQFATAVTEGFTCISHAVSALTDAEAERPLHISTTTNFATHWLMPRLAEFREKHPTIDLIIAPSAERADPAQGGVDLAIRYGDGKWPGFEVKRLMDAPIVGVASPTLLKSAPSDISLLGNYTWFEELGAHEASNWMTSNGIAPTAGVVTVPGHLALNAARTGEGIAVTARPSVEADLAAGRLIELFEDSRDYGYYLLTRPGVQRPPLRQFVLWLERMTNASKSWST